MGKSNMGTDNIFSEKESIDALRNRIQELEMVEEKLRERIDAATREGDLLYALMNNIPDSIYFKDKNSRFVCVNKAWSFKRNLSDPAEAIGKSDFDYFSEKFAQHTFEAEKEIMQTCKPQEAQLEELQIEGERRWYTSSKVPVKNKNGATIGTCGITRDITDLKRIEEELAKTNLQLEIRVQERTFELKEANNRLELQIDQLNFLNSAAFSLAQSISRVDVYSAILDAFKPCFPKIAGCICALDDTEQPQIKSKTPGFDHEELPLFIERALRLFTSHKLQEPVLIPEWRKNHSLNIFQWPVSFDQSCCVLVPLRSDDKIISCLVIFTTSEFAERYVQEKSVVMTLSTIAAVCQKNAKYYDGLQNSARLEGELIAARNIQKSLIPQSRLSLPHMEIYGYYLPAYEVGGDYLDYFVNEEGYVVIAIGDVCGKGAPASMHMTMLRTTLRIKARNETSASKLVCEVNNSIRCDLSSLSFISLLCIIVNADKTELTYARAGHPPMLKFDNCGTTPSIVECGGIALGLLSDTTPLDSYIEEIFIHLKQGDKFFIYTDGLVEAINSADQNYGMENLINVLHTTTAADPKAIIDAVNKDVDNFKDSVPHRDDLTLCSFTIV
jgi:PAS domain S-box-containing protein